MNYGKLLSKAQKKLSTNNPENKNKDITNPYLEAELLLSKIIKKTREHILSHKENKISLINKWRFNYLIYKRLNNHPLAYLLQEKYFYAYKFKVNKNTLIPRAESEMMVEELVNLIKNNPNEKYSIFDIGTGSGCIIISVLKELKNKLPEINIEELNAVDISFRALKIAKQNAVLHKLNQKIKFLHGDLLAPIIKNKQTNKIKNHLIISANLPYLKSSQLNHPSIKYEPVLALYGGLKGIDYYRRLLLETKTIKNQYKQISLFLEIDPSQKELLNSLILKTYPEAEIKIKKDLRGLFRLIIINL